VPAGAVVFWASEAPVNARKLITEATFMRLVFSKDSFQGAEKLKNDRI